MIGWPYAVCYLPWDIFPCTRPQYTWCEDNHDLESGMNENSEKEEETHGITTCAWELKEIIFGLFMRERERERTAKSSLLVSVDERLSIFSCTLGIKLTSSEQPSASNKSWWESWEPSWATQLVSLVSKPAAKWKASSQDLLWENAN